MTQENDKNNDLVNAVERALSLLDAFTINDPSVSLAELSRRTKIPKTSVLRLARTLAARGYLTSVGGGAWRLGAATAWLSAKYQVAFDVHNLIEPEMRELGRATGRNVSYFVHDGDSRIRLFHIVAQDGAKRLVRVGEALPLDRGSPGKVLLAFSGRKGKLFDEIRTLGYHFTIGEAKATVASVAAPVFGASSELVGALCIGLPAIEADEALLRRLAPQLIKAAAKLSRKFGTASVAPSPRETVPATWFPREVF
jgi:DNA-binding IclR family transcriptional regulator